MRTGNLSQINYQIFDPATTAPCASCPSGYSRQPFPGNIIPNSRFNSATFALLNAYPAETSSGLNSAGFYVGDNYTSNGVDKITREQVNVRGDYAAPSGKDVVFGRFSMTNSTMDLALGAFRVGSFPGYGDHFITPSRNVVFHEAHTFNPTTVMEVLASYFRNFPDFGAPTPPGPITNADLGISTVRQSASPDVSPSGLSNLWGNPFAPEYDLTNQFQYILSLTKVSGRHTLKFGGEYNRWQFYENHAPRFPQGLYQFNGQLTADPNNTSGTGSGIADFLLGYPTSAQTIEGDDSGLFYRNNFRWYANEEIRASSNLTMNAGIRWEYDGPECEKYDRLTNFDPTTGTIIVAGAALPGWSGSAQFQGFPVQGGNCSTIGKDLNNYGPRAGFAYRLPGHESTVVRGGYGVFYDVMQVNAVNDTRANFPYATFPNLTINDPSTYTPNLGIQDVFAPGAPLSVRPSFKAVATNLRAGYSQHASVTLEHQFAAPFLVSVGGSWLHNIGFIDQPNLDVPLKNGTFILPWPQLTSLTYLNNQQYGHYYGLLAKVQSRQWRGITLITSFTWSKSLDDTTAGDSSLGGTAGDAGNQNPHCIACDFGRSADDFERRFTQSWVYNLPTPFKSYNSRAAKGILGGWEWSGVLTLQSGFPVTPSVSIDNSESLEYADRPNRVPGVPVFTARESHAHSVV